MSYKKIVIFLHRNAFSTSPPYYAMPITELQIPAKTESLEKTKFDLNDNLECDKKPEKLSIKILMTKLSLLPTKSVSKLTI